MQPMHKADMQKRLPEYRVPTTGILSYLPPTWVPYAELTRLAKPTGIFNIYFPYLFGALYASWLGRVPLTSLFLRNAILFVAAFVLRSAGCSWNDIVDREVDRDVIRCRLRPMARQAITVKNALYFTAAQTVVWLSILSIIIPNHWVYTIPLTGMVMFYPFAKRCTNYAQAVLGITLSMGVLIGSVAMGVDPMAVQPHASYTSGLAALFFSYVVWSIIHDTIYAQQDVKDDVAAGLMSMAVRYRHHVKQLLSALCLIQTLLLVHTGAALDAGLLYQIPASAGSALLVAWMLLSVDPDSPSDCAWWFQNGSLAYGALLSAGFFAEYLGRSFGASLADVVTLDNVAKLASSIDFDLLITEISKS